MAHRMYRLRTPPWWAMSSLWVQSPCFVRHSTSCWLSFQQIFAHFKEGILPCPSRGFLASLSQPPVSPLPPGINLKGKTAIIPGSNGGIGYEAARQLQGLNISNVILAVRSMPKGEATKNTHAADNTVKLQKVMHLDMDDYHSVASFAAAVKIWCPSLKSSHAQRWHYLPQTGV